MKLKILIILLTGFVCHHLLAQENPQLPAPHCSANINTITTDWRRTDSSNNTWDWTKEFYDDAFIAVRNQQQQIEDLKAEIELFKQKRD